MTAVWEARQKKKKKRSFKIITKEWSEVVTRPNRADKTLVMHKRTSTAMRPTRSHPGAATMTAAVPVPKGSGSAVSWLPATVLLGT